MRKAEIARKTAETDIRLLLELDGAVCVAREADRASGAGGGGWQSSKNGNISTGCGFFDHMLSLFALHGSFYLSVRCVGDVEVDYHHTVEDVGIALGDAFLAALADKAGICRYGSIILPMDEALILAAVDISGRGMLLFDMPGMNPRVGDFDTELVEEFFIAFARRAGVTLHLRALSGVNTHHIIEGAFKAFGRALAQAVGIDSRRNGAVPSSKGVL